MLERGFLAEVEKLSRAGYHAAHKAMQSLGYRELLDVVEGRCDLPTARAAIVARRGITPVVSARTFAISCPRRHVVEIATPEPCPDGRGVPVRPALWATGPRPAVTTKMLEFERPIVDLERKIASSGCRPTTVDFSAEIRKLEQKARKLQREVFADLTPSRRSSCPGTRPGRSCWITWRC